jgi:nucleoside-diphosphate-sugar epimerase
MTMGFSIYGGTGNIGSYFIGLYGGRPLQRTQLAPMDEEVLYLISTTSNSYSDPLFHTDTNIDALMRRLVACKEAGIKTFNFVSSWFVYGPHHGLMKEEDPCMPKGLYSITKRCAEQLVMDYCSHYGIAWRILRLGNVYGGHDISNGQRNALHYIIQELKANRIVEGVGGMRRDYIHIYDTCRAIQHVCKEGPRNAIYNIGSGRSTFLSQCISYCKETMQSKSIVSYRMHRNDEQSLVMALDCTKLFDTGFSPLISLEEGLTDLCTSQKFSTPLHFSMGTKSKLQLAA